ncbi:MAG: DDE-type integrase/transposase/recombinase [Thiobacillus sp.]|nr:DDE-type integrase/transposase/recombinase [Thiobacillus sp.]
MLDEFNREGLGIEADLSLPAARVIRSLDQIIEWRGRPSAIRCDNGPEYISGALLAWAEVHEIRIEHIQTLLGKNFNQPIYGVHGHAATGH